MTNKLGRKDMLKEKWSLKTAYIWQIMDNRKLKNGLIGKVFLF